MPPPSHCPPRTRACSDQRVSDFFGLLRGLGEAKSYHGVPQASLSALTLPRPLRRGRRKRGSDAGDAKLVSQDPDVARTTGQAARQSAVRCWGMGSLEMPLEAITLRFPDGSWEYRTTERLPEAGDTLVRAGVTWDVVGVTDAVDDHRVVTMAAPPPEVRLPRVATKTGRRR